MGNERAATLQKAVKAIKSGDLHNMALSKVIADLMANSGVIRHEVDEVIADARRSFMEKVAD